MSGKNKQYRYQVLAQDFTLARGECLFIVRDNQLNQTAKYTAEVLFTDDDFLKYMSPTDIKMIGYIHACETTQKYT